MGGLWTGVQPVHLYNTSQMVSKYSGMLVQPNKAIVGANAFSHESGMHQDGMLKHRETYQIMAAETIGLQQKSTGDAGIVLGKHSGRHALATHLHHLGYDLSKQEVDDLFKRFKVGGAKNACCQPLFASCSSVDKKKKPRLRRLISCMSAAPTLPQPNPTYSPSTQTQLRLLLPSPLP